MSGKAWQRRPSALARQALWPYAALIWLAFSAERAWLRRRRDSP